MDEIISNPANNGFNRLRKLINSDRINNDRCELCSLALSTLHQHLFDAIERKILCTCQACALLFTNQQTKYRAIPQRVISLPNFLLTDAQWDNLRIPIGLAFFFYNSPIDQILSLYAGPAGAIESPLDINAWQEIVNNNSILKTMQPDVEALLIKRLSDKANSSLAQYYLVPIDECYKLVGIMRIYWHGLSGGQQVWQEIDNFFNRLQQRAIIKGDTSCAGS